MTFLLFYRTCTLWLLNLLVVRLRDRNWCHKTSTNHKLRKKKTKTKNISHTINKYFRKKSKEKYDFPGSSYPLYLLDECHTFPNITPTFSAKKTNRKHKHIKRYFPDISLKWFFFILCILLSEPVLRRGIYFFFLPSHPIITRLVEDNIQKIDKKYVLV